MGAMALVRIEILKGRSAQEKRELLAAVHEALVAALRIPRGDPTLRIVEHDPANFQRPSVPHVTSERYTLVEIIMFSGRSEDAKRALYQEIVRRLAELEIPAEDVTIVLLESPQCNWGVHGGYPASEVELGFQVEI
jgi:phenylpyruvate tautomerase PptA (4-oxalocrotonate tautomerase family)